ncbi:hypothetical protein Tco_1325016 [Tanacetum coccineum]
MVTEGATLEASLITEGAALEASLVTEGITLKDNMVAKKSSSSGNDADAEKILVETVTSGIEHADTGPLYDSDTVSENNSNIISAIPNMDLIRDKEEHDYIDDMQQRAFFDSLVNNLKCEVENYSKVNREAQQANALLTKEIEKYKENEKTSFK